MGFIKVVKNNAYFKRFQVKFRRRREGKTDYYARQRLITQDKNKYNTPKYRLVVRLTNKDVVAQIVYSRIIGDFVMCSAYSHELPRYGVPVGLTNYAACYCTGLLLARRVLSQLHLATRYPGVTEVNGRVSQVEALPSGARPFRAFLDIGLHRTTTGARIFAVMKGASDGGMDVPHNEKRFVGFKKGKFNPKVLREHLFGQHVAQYMRILQDEDPEKYQIQFSRFIKNNLTADGLEQMYTQAHAAIRANPAPKEKRTRPEEEKHYPNRCKKPLSNSQRKARIAQKIASMQSE